MTRDRGSIRTIPVLLYHGISDEPSSGAARFTLAPGAFEEHMRRLVDAGYRSLTVSAFVPALRGEPGGLPERPVVITFDDGFHNFLSEALPIMERHGLVSTLYATTGFMGEGDSPGANRWGDRMLSWSELVEVARRGVEVGGHSDTHPMLDTLPRGSARAEIVRCKDLIEQHLQAPVASFAYPHGYSSASVRETVQQAGYTSACAVKNALSHLGDDPFAIARLMLETTHSLDDFDRMLSGEGVPVARSSDRLKTRGWRLARRSMALGQRIAARS